MPDFVNFRMFFVFMMPVAPEDQLMTSKRSDGWVVVRIAVKSHDLRLFLTFMSDRRERIHAVTEPFSRKYFKGRASKGRRTTKTPLLCVIFLVCDSG